MSRVRPVVLDLDGVLADFLSGYRELCRELGRPEPASWQWDDYCDDHVWQAIRKSSTFWYRLSPLVTRGTFWRIDRLPRVLGLEAGEPVVYFATSREGLRVHSQSVQWLRGYGVFNPTVVITHRKGEFARSVDAAWLLDDKAGNAVYAAYESPRTTVCLLDAPYNRFDHKVLGGRVRRVYSVEEFLNLVESSLALGN